LSTQFKDHFSGHAETYARHRPGYPDELFAYLLAQVPSTRLAWDCGTGNGQAALGLAKGFTRVVATDPSIQQLKNAFSAPNVSYLCSLAEKPALAAASADLVTVAQALHWFDIPRFFSEVRSVLKPGGVVAVWGYALCRINPELDAVIDDYYWHKVGPYWPKERKHVDEAYSSISFPFDEWQAPEMHILLDWNLDDLLAYLRTWSPTRRYIEAHGSDPVDEVAPALAALWGEPSVERKVVWPIFMRIGKV
jgi:SAM-dependent methyltransferase